MLISTSIRIKVLCCVLIGFSCSSFAQALTTERKEQLAHLVKQDCGSCHGMTLKGGLGPELTKQALQDKSIDFIKITILYGRPGTAMPPWRTILKEKEAEWISEQLKQGEFHE